MTSKRKFIIAIHLILYSNDWVVFMDSKRYPFVVYRKKGVDKELKVPRADMLDYDGAYELLTIIITTLNEQFGIKEIKEEAFSGWSKVESVLVDEAKEIENE